MQPGDCWHESDVDFDDGHVLVTKSLEELKGNYKNTRSVKTKKAGGASTCPGIPSTC